MADTGNCIMVRFDDTGLFVEAHPRKRNSMNGYVYVGDVDGVSDLATEFNFKMYQKSFKKRMSTALNILSRGGQVRMVDSDGCRTAYDVRRLFQGQYILRIVDHNGPSYYMLDKNDVIDHLIWICSTDEDITEVEYGTMFGEVQQYIWIKSSEFSTTQRFCKNV